MVNTFLLVVCELHLKGEILFLVNVFIRMSEHLVAFGGKERSI